MEKFNIVRLYGGNSLIIGDSSVKEGGASCCAAIGRTWARWSSLIMTQGFMKATKAEETDSEG